MLKDILDLYIVIVLITLFIVMIVKFTKRNFKNEILEKNKEKCEKYIERMQSGEIINIDFLSKKFKVEEKFIIKLLYKLKRKSVVKELFSLKNENKIYESWNELDDEIEKRNEFKNKDVNEIKKYILIYFRKK